MARQVITKEDLHTFKQELLDNVKEILFHYHPSSKRWIKSAEVCKLLRVSKSTLQGWRRNGTVPYFKLGGTIYYALEDILKLMERRTRDD